jgi:hypothetical protein
MWPTIGAPGYRVSMAADEEPALLGDDQRFRGRRIFLGAFPEVFLGAPVAE